MAYLRYRIQNYNFLEENKQQYLDEYQQLQKIIMQRTIIPRNSNFSQNHTNCYTQEGLMGGNTQKMGNKLAQNAGSENLDLQNHIKKSSVLSIPLTEDAIKTLEQLGIIENQKLKNPQPRIKLVQNLVQIIQQKSQKSDEEIFIENLVNYLQLGAQASFKTLDKDIILLLGTTGVGKSTMIHFLAGVQIEDLANKKQNGKSSFRKIPILQISNMMEEFKVSSGLASKTLFINVIEIQGLSIADSAGLLDTKGDSFNLANTVSLEKALHKAKSVKLVILVNSASIFGPNRGRDLINLIIEIIGYFKSEQVEKFIPSITLVITHAQVQPSDYLNILKLFLQTENGPECITTDPDVRPKVIKFLEAMVCGAEFQLKRNKIKQLKKDIRKTQEKLRALKQKVELQDISRLQRKLIEDQKQIIQTEYKIKKIKLKDDLSESDKQKKINSLLQQIDDFQRSIKGIKKKIEQRNQGLKQTYKAIENEERQLQNQKQESKLIQDSIELELLKAKKQRPQSFFNDFLIYYPQRVCDKQERISLINSLKLGQSIKNTKQNFQVSIQNNLKTSTQSMVNKIVLSLHDLVKDSKYQISEKKLDDIIYLSQEIKTSIIEKSKENCFKIIKDSIQKNCKRFKGLLDDSISQKGQISNEGIQVLTQCVRNLDSTQTLVQKIPNFNSVEFSQSGLYNYLVKRFELIANYVLISIKTVTESSIFKAGFAIEKLEKLYLAFGNEIPKIHELYQKFTKDLFETFSNRVQDAKQCLQKGDYKSLTQNLTFVKQFKKAIDGRFDFDSDKVYKVLVSLTLSSLEERCTIGFAKILSSLTSETVKILQQEFVEFTQLEKQTELMRHIGAENFEKTVSLSSGLIQSHSLKLISIIKEKIAKNSFEQLKQPMSILCDIRKIDDSIAAKTSEEYARFISRLQTDLTGRSNQIINEVMRKVKLGNVEDSQILNLKQVLTKLSKMTWLQSVLGSQGIKQMLEKTMNELNNHASSISSHIKNTFYKDLEKCEDEELSTSDDSFSDIESTSRSRVFRIQKRFSVLNSSINFCKKLSEINQELKSSFTKITSEINSLIDSECARIDKLIQSNVESFNLHKIQLERQIIRINSMRNIDLGIEYKVEESLKKLCFGLQNYFENCSNIIEKTNFSNDDLIKKCCTTCSKLFSSLSVCDRMLEKKNVNIEDYRSNLLKILKDKFYEFLESIDKNMKQHKFNDALGLLDILKRYRTSDVNILLENQMKIKYETLFSDYSKQINDIPNDIDSYFKLGQFSELIIVLEEYKKNGNDRGCRNIQQKIKNTIEMESQLILDEIFGLSSCERTTFRNLNTSIKRFNQYTQIKELIQNLAYDEKRKQITYAIGTAYQTLVAQAKRNLTILSFRGIKHKIDRIIDFHDILLRNITDADYRIKRVDIKIEFQNLILSIIEEDLARQWKKYFSYIDKLKIIDEQFQGRQFRSEYVKKLKAHIKKLCAEIKDGIKMAQNDQLDQYQIKLKNLKNQTIDYLSGNLEFNVFLDEYREIEKQISDFFDLQTNDNKYSNESLSRIRVSNGDSYIKLIKELKTEYDMISTKIEEAKKSKNYGPLSSSLNQLQKFKPLHTHLRFTPGKTPSDLELSIKNLINKKCSTQKQQIFRQLDSQNVENSAEFSNFKDYLQILLNFELNEQKDNRIIEDAKSIHLKIIETLEKIIPKINKNPTVSEQNHRLQTLLKYEVFVSILKKYVESISSLNKVETFIYCNFSKFSFAIRSIESASQFESKLCSSIRSLPVAVKGYFDTDQFKKISETLTDVKNTKTTQSARAYVDLSDLVRKLIESLGTEVVNNVEDRKLQGVNVKINKIGKAEEQFKNIKGLVPPKPVFEKVISHIDTKIRKELVNAAKNKVSGKKAEQAIKDIIEIKKWVEEIPILEKMTYTHLEQIFVEAQKHKTVGKIVQELEKQKKDDKIATLCNQVLLEHRQKLSIPRLMPKMTITIEDCIAQFKGEKQDSIDKDQLLMAYRIYLDQYERLRQRYISASARQYIAQNLAAIKEKAFETLQNIGSSDKFDEETKKNVPILLAQLFIYMSVMRSAQSFYNALESQDNSEYASYYLLQPHPIQVLAILRFIGCDTKTGLLEKLTGGLISLNKLQNHLMQIKTGEGKSIILGAMSLLLSLMGNEVYCVCYSAYLSERDFLSFKDMFEAFDVIEKIKYGTFSEISEMIINEEGNVRTLVSNLFSSDKKSDQFGKKAKSKGSRVLLVDQVDTFFSKDFYGNTYNPCVLLENVNVVEIIKFIWAHRNDNSSQIETLMKATAHYKNVCNEYKDCVSKIDGQLKIMISDVKNFKSRDYVVQNSKIGYKELDGVSFNSVYGYETMFLYMHQHALGNITEQTLKENLGITLSCGSFSYAEMIDGFDKIFGVSGTLENLNLFEQNILKRYKITSKTFAPSVYGGSRRTEKPILIEEGQGRYYQTIASSILESIKNKGSVLVFFENQVELQKFKNSSYTEHFRKNMNVVTEKSYDRDFLIKKATSSELVTLFTAPFGRGTDFLVFNPIVKQRGIDVIQTFLSQELSEEIQVKGRTARQGAKGTYQLILELGELTKKYKVTKEMISKATQNPADSVAKLLQRNRVEFCNAFNSQREKNLEQSKKAHINSLAKRNAIIQKRIVRDDQFFFATTSGSSGKARICVTIDSTGSMGSTIAAVKDRVMKMIEKLAKEYPNQFEIQIMFYYGDDAYNTTRNSSSWCSTNKLHVSPWSADVKVLSDFLKSASASGGSGHEAIEVALHHLIKCNEEVGMNKAILIGDAGLEGRLDSSLDYQVHPENQSRYAPGVASKPMKLVLSNLLSELKTRGVQVDTYPIGNGQQIQVTGKQISDGTGGKMTLFDPSKDDLGAKIESVITECIKMKR